MDRGKRYARVIRDDVFSAVAMVRVEVPDGDAFGAVFQGIERSNRDVTEIAKSHRLLTRGVMAGRPHQAERALAPQS